MQTQTEKLDLSTAAKRLKALRTALSVATSSLAHAANVFHEMEAADDDVSMVDRFTAMRLRRIYKGDVLPEVYTQFDGTMQNAVQSMPVPQQRKMLADNPVEVVTGDTHEVLTLPPSKLTRFQIRQVFGRGYIRDAAEQRAWLETEKAREVQQRTPKQPAGIRVDKKKRGVWFGDTFVALKELLRLVESLTE